MWDIPKCEFIFEKLLVNYDFLFLHMQKWSEHQSEKGLRQLRRSVNVVGPFWPSGV